MFHWCLRFLALLSLVLLVACSGGVASVPDPGGGDGGGGDGDGGGGGGGGPAALPIR